MKSIGSALILSLFCLTYSLAGVAAEQKENIEQWRIYTDKETNPSFKAILFSFDGEDGALVVRCQNRQPELYFMLGDQLPLKVNSALVFKVDSTAVNVGQWQRAADGKGIFSLSPLPLLQQLAGKQSLILTYQTVQGSYKVAAFYLLGINQVAQKMTTICQA